MFGHPSQHAHMLSGVAKAAASPKTPPHLKAHLEKRMKQLNPKAGFNPQTAAKSQNKPAAIKQGGGGSAAQSQISGPPMPFQNKLGAANLQRGRANSAAMKGVGNGASANSANLAGTKAPKGVPASPGNPFPKKRSSGAARTKFYGG